MIKKKSNKLLRRNKLRYYRKVIIWVSFLIIALYGLSFWSDYQSLNIQEVEITGENFVAPEIIEKVFWQETEGKYFFLISKRNFLFIPKKIIIEKIKKFNEVENVSIEISNSNKVIIKISEYKPVAEYCLEKCYFVNKKGVVFSETPKIYVDDLLKLEGKIIEDENEIIGMNYLPIEIFEKIIKTIELLNIENIKINKVSTEDFETFNLQTVGGPRILIEYQDIPEEIVSNLKIALEQESIHDIQFNNLEYIDLRFQDNVFYKLK